MACPPRTITTLDELSPEEFPVLRLRYAPPAAHNVFDLSGITGFFTRSCEEVHENMEHIADEETTRRNQERIAQNF